LSIKFKSSGDLQKTGPHNIGLLRREANLHLQKEDNPPSIKTNKLTGWQEKGLFPGISEIGVIKERQ
jgi:hypothetical protein